MDIGSIRADMQPFGDSLIVGGHGEKVRVHIHTDTPDRLFFTIKRHGSLTQQKADDMRRQVDVCRNRMHSVALVTDSTCDLPQEYLDRNQVHVVPLRLAFGESVYLDRVTLSSDQFYTLLRDGESPSVPSPHVRFREDLPFPLEHYGSVIAMHISSKLSGTWNASRAAAERREDPVIDSRTASAPRDSWS